MVRAINPEPDDFWLDPCMGPGAFISALRKNGLSKQRIIGVDIDPCPSAEDEAATTVRGVDFFAWCASMTKRFTKVVANPPYVALCKLEADLQNTVQQFHDSDPSFALRSNYWCAFLSACLGLLKPDGSLAFVLPAAWDYALYAHDLRARVLSSFKSVEVHRSLEPLFPEVREGRIVLLAKGYLQTPEHAARIDHPTATSLKTFDLFRSGSHSPGHQFLPDTLHAQVMLDELAELGVVIRTATARLGLLPLDLPLKSYGIYGPRVLGRDLLNEHPFLSALLGSGTQAVRAFGKIRNTIPLRIAPNAPEFLAHEFFGDELTVD